MTRKKKSLGASLVRSSAAEYLTFVAASGGGGVEAVYADENVWLSQKMMAQLYDVEVPTINYHLKDLSPNVEKFGQALRDFRNYVHPAEQLANRFTPDQHTARIGFQVVVAAAEDLVQAEARLSTSQEASG